MPLITINTDPIKTEHVSWAIKKDGLTLDLLEIVNIHYIHPQSDGHATISQLEYKFYEKFNLLRDVAKTSDIMLLYHALNNITLNRL